MIIVSQTKNNIVNFENINLIGLDGEFKIKARLGINDAVLLGKYKTEERAKEVLQEVSNFYEIAKRHESSGNDGLTIYLENKFTYQMPLE